MQIIVLVIKEIIQGLRDFKSMILMIIMPTILTSILGIALKYDTKALINFSNVNVVYNNYLCTSEEKVIVKEYINALEKLRVSCTFSEEKYKKDENIIYLEFMGLNNINVKYNGKLKDEGEYIVEVLNNINNQSKLLRVINYSEMESKVTDEEENSVNLKPITGINTSISLNYYGITMVVITIMFSSVTGAYKVIKERELGTLNKILTLPLSKTKVLLGKLLGSIIVVLIQILFTLFISKNILNVNWGNSILSIVCILLCEGIFAVSIGLFIGSLVRDNKSAWMILLTVIMGCGFFGGSFVLLGTMKSKILTIIGNVNFIKYENIALLNIIYENSFSLAINLSIIYLLLSLILISITSIIMGDLR